MWSMQQARPVMVRMLIFLFHSSFQSVCRCYFAVMGATDASTTCVTNALAGSREFRVIDAWRDLRLSRPGRIHTNRLDNSNVHPCRVGTRPSIRFQFCVLPRFESGSG
jgi:hypothetical protein